MKRFVLAFITVLVLTLFPAPANAADGCVVNVLGVKVCGQLLNQPLPPVVRVTTTLPPITVPGPTRTVNVPGPTQNRTVVRNVVVPGPTRTVPAPGGTVTVTTPPKTLAVTAPSKSPQASPDKVTETVRSTVTATKTVTVRETGQKPGSDGKVSDTHPFLTLPPVTLSGPETVGVGLAGLLVLCGLIILGLWLGYILGYKDKERKEMKFLDALRDQFYVGKHS